MNRMWKASSNKKRLEAISEIETIISKSNAFIIDYKMFSDMMLSLKLEVQEKDMNALYYSLSEVLNFNNKVSFENISSSKEIELSLTITFILSKGDLKIETPAVPG